MKARLGGLRVRLVVAFVAIALISACITTGLAYRESRQAILSRAQDGFVSSFRSQINSRAATFELPADTEALASMARSVADGLDGSPRVVARYRNLAGASEPFSDQSRIHPELRSRVATTSRTSWQRVQFQGDPYLTVGSPVLTDTGQRSGLEMFAIFSLDAERSDISAIIDAARTGTIPVVLSALILALLASGTVLRPVHNLSAVTRRQADGELGVRVTVRGRDEIAELGRSFNNTADALQASITQLREQEALAKRFVSDTSHELRTPLAALSLVATVLDDEAETLTGDTAQAARTVSTEVARLCRLVDDLLEMSRFDAGVARLELEEVDLATAVRSTLDLRAWDDHVRDDLRDGITAVVDRRRLDVIIANLVANAIQHGHPPVTIAADLDGSGFTITVCDEGPGFSPESLPHVFDRFYKGDSARPRSPGSGLGMAIALENARLHQGTIHAGNRSTGGARVSLWMPQPQNRGDM